MKWNSVFTCTYFRLSQVLVLYKLRTAWKWWLENTHWQVLMLWAYYKFCTHSVLQWMYVQSHIHPNYWMPAHFVSSRCTVVQESYTLTFLHADNYVTSLSHTLNSCMRSISQQLSFSFCPPHPFLPQGNETDQPTTELGHCGWCHSVVHICGSEGHTNGGPHYCHRALWSEETWDCIV